MQIPALDSLEGISRMAGFPPLRRQVEGAYDCPVHHVRLQVHQLGAFNGWHEVQLCPAHDGSCAYGPDQNPTRIDQPEEATEEAPAGSTVIPAVADEVIRDLGNGMVLVLCGSPARVVPPADPNEGVTDNGDGTHTWSFRIYDGLTDEYLYDFEPVSVDGAAPAAETVSTHVDGVRTYFRLLMRAVPGRNCSVLVAASGHGEPLPRWLRGGPDTCDQFGQKLFTALLGPVMVEGAPRKIRVHVEPTVAQTLALRLRRGPHWYPVKHLRLADVSVENIPAASSVRVYVKNGEPYADVQVLTSRGGNGETALGIALLGADDDVTDIGDWGVGVERCLDAGTLTVNGKEMRVLVTYDED